jgi:PAS domain S-box-containing protein
MAGLKIHICFWYLDPVVLENVISTLREGGFDPVTIQCKDRIRLRKQLKTQPPELIISDFDLPADLRDIVEQEQEPYISEIALVYLVGEKNEREAVESLKRGAWDYVLKGKLDRLVPSVYSFQKYSRAVKERRLTEEALSASRERYASIFSAVNDGILLFDFNTRKIQEYNPRILEMFEVGREEMEVLDISQFSCIDEGYTIEKARGYIAEAVNGEPVTFEWRNLTKSGRRFWTLNSFSIIQINGRSWILLVSRTIEKQKRMEQSLLESQEHFRALAENSPDVIMRFDRELRHVYLNNSIEAQTGLKVKDFVGRTHREMGIFPDHKVEIWESALEKVFRTGKSHTIEFDLDVSEKTIRYEWRLYPEIGSSEAIQSVIGVARDITESRKAQEVLKESEERLNLALQATGLGMWDWNLATGEVYYSPLWMSMLGYEPDELPQKLETWTNLLHPEDRSMVIDLVQASIENREESFEFEFRLKNKSGGYTWVRAGGKAVGHDGQGNTIRLTGIHENIDERKRSDMIRQVLYDISTAVSSTQSLDELYDKIRESLGRVVDTTNCFLALYNQKTDTLSMPFMKDEMDSFTEFPAKKTLTSYVIRTGEPQLVNVERERELTEMGEIEPVGAPCVSWLGVPLRRDGNTIGVFAVQSYSDDVVYTAADAALLEFASDQIALAIDRRRHQDNIRATQEKQRRVFESSPDPMIVTDPRAAILDFNSAFLEVFNVEADKVYGEKIFRFIRRNQWRQALKDFEMTWEKGYLKNLEYEIVRPDGLSFDGEVSSGAIYSGDGKPESMVLIVKNITERKDAERKLLEAKDKAEESDKLKTAFLSNMSHEIRTPMNAIVGFSDLLSDENLTHEERRDFVAQINQGADDLMRLIDDIIDIAKIEAGQVNMHIAECFVRDLYKELHLMFLQNLKRTGKEHVDLKIQWNWPLSDLALYTDPFRLKQILVNLLSNAVKFTDEGEILLGIEEHPGGVRFYVTDSGIGIREEKQNVIFDRFMQGHETKTKLYGGTGLGLAISKNLTEILGGEIGVQSRVGEGSTFWFILPRNEVPLKHEAALKAPISNIRSWEDKKLLIAEDDQSNYYFLYEALRDTGVHILWAKDGQEALDVFHKNPDLNAVLMDIQMPFLNGYECTRLIKKERPGLPVIAQTAYAMSGEREISREAGCDDYLSKPIKVNELLNTLSRYI